MNKRGQPKAPLKTVEKRQKDGKNAFPLEPVRRLMRWEAEGLRIGPAAVGMMEQAVQLFIKDVVMQAADSLARRKQRVITKADIVDVLVSDKDYDFLIDFLPEDRFGGGYVQDKYDLENEDDYGNLF